MTAPAVPTPLPSGVKKFRKKPVVIEAIQWTGDNCDEVFAFLGIPHEPHDEKIEEVIIETLEGPMIARIGWWIIKDIHGEFYPCEPAIFEATYDLVYDPEA